MAYKVNFSIPETDKEVFEKLNSMKRNKSRYIVDLIKKDIGLIENSSSSLGNIDTSILETLINNKVQEAVSNLNINSNKIATNDLKDKSLLKEAASKNDDNDDFI